MAQQTNFVKVSIMQIEILNICSASLFSYMKSKAKLGPTPIDGVYISELLFAKKTQNLKPK